MLCQICRKNPATVHIQEIVNGERRTLHFCAQCAEKKSMLEPLFKDFDLPGILKEIMEQAAGGAVSAQETPKKEKQEEKTVCPVCGWDSIRWKKYGRLGCPACYDAFSERLNRELICTQHGLHHKGKGAAESTDAPVCKTKKSASGIRASAQIQKKQQLERLKNDLKESVRREEYELAAELRDRIAELESSLTSGGKEV